VELLGEDTEREKEAMASARRAYGAQLFMHFGNLVIL
jgi:hypothetical protein